MTELSRIDAIRERAYAIWEEAGRPHGREYEHWLQAEAELGAPPPANGKRRRQPAAPRPPGKTGRTRAAAVTGSPASPA